MINPTRFAVAVYNVTILSIEGAAMYEEANRDFLIALGQWTGPVPGQDYVLHGHLGLGITEMPSNQDGRPVYCLTQRMAEQMVVIPLRYATLPAAAHEIGIVKKHQTIIARHMDRVLEGLIGRRPATDGYVRIMLQALVDNPGVTVLDPVYIEADTGILRYRLVEIGRLGDHWVDVLKRGAV